MIYDKVVRVAVRRILPKPPNSFLRDLGRSRFSVRIRQRQSFPIDDPDVEECFVKNRSALPQPGATVSFTVVPLPIDRAVVYRLLDASLADPDTVPAGAVKELAKQKGIVYRT